jgi:hypothetical protein
MKPLKSLKILLYKIFPSRMSKKGWKYNEFEWENWLITWGHLVISASINRNYQHQEHDFFFLPKKIIFSLCPMMKLYIWQGHCVKHTFLRRERHCLP